MIADHFASTPATIVIVAWHNSLICWLTAIPSSTTLYFITSCLETFRVDLVIVSCSQAVRTIVMLLLVCQSLLELGDFLRAAFVFHPVVINQLVKSRV